MQDRGTDPGGTGRAERQLDPPGGVQHHHRAHHRRHPAAGRGFARPAQLAFAEHRVQVHSQPRQPHPGADPERGGDHAGVAVPVEHGNVGGFAVTAPVPAGQCTGQRHRSAWPVERGQVTWQGCHGGDGPVQVRAREYRTAGQPGGPGRLHQHPVAGQIRRSQRAPVAPYRRHQGLCDRAGVESGRAFGRQRRQRVGQAGVVEQVTRAEQVTFRRVHPRSRPHRQRRRDRWQRRGVHRRQRYAAAGQRDGGCDHLRPGQPAVPPVQLAATGRHARYADTGAADLVRQRYGTEADRNRSHRLGRSIPVGARHRAEEIQAGDLSGGCLEIDREPAAAEPGHDRLAHAGGEHRSHRRVGRRTAGSQDVRTHLRGRRVPGRHPCHRPLPPPCAE